MKKIDSYSAAIGAILGGALVYFLTRKTTNSFAGVASNTKVFNPQSEDTVDWKDLIKNSNLDSKTKLQLNTSGKTPYYTGGCVRYPGTAGYVGMAITNWADSPNGQVGIIVGFSCNGSGMVVCPKGQTSDMPVCVNPPCSCA